MANRNAASLFRHHHRQCVRLLRNAEAGAVPQTKAAIERFALAYRKNASRGCDPAVANDHAAIVQCRFRMKNRQHQLDRKIAVQHDTGFLVNAD